MARNVAPIAWVESPLQMIGAAEWAAAHGAPVDLAARLAEQVEHTAADLHERGAMFAERAAYYGIPWRALAAHDHWLVGDGFSGQFRLAVTLLRPRRITFLDDGRNTLPFADALVGAERFCRPGVAERGLTRRLAPVALDAVRMRAAAGAVDLFTAFPLGEERTARLRDLGATASGHAFEWLRGARPPQRDGTSLRTRRLILGSALVVDGRVDRDEYLAWVRREARGRDTTYLPHRREPEDVLAEVERIGGVRVVRSELPVELVLAGQRRPHEIVTQPSSAAVTLRMVLAGTESVVRERADLSGARRESVA